MNRALLHKDLIGGGLLIVVGIAVLAHSVTYHIGTLVQMGPGFFPFFLGLILGLVGCGIAVQGYLSVRGAAQPDSLTAKKKLQPEWKAWILICMGMVAFVVLTKYLGLVAGTFAVVFISALGDRGNNIKSAVLLAAAMVAVAVVVFWWALQIQLPLFKWGAV
ncbi:tripartite tricarboxylate transporter TctB family protein [Paraburkholderia phenoliruptrix]|uniref:tripartite tricarboxylate transporter TctB family protein n=1 Tax=Paraburkholderia phenoliruptrix TaxID=252970 RepID=UPI001C6DFC64|nr:tripartite tricarboxylate transporter TctB family protein [Paraburkholderia phenoliruptrix]MBW9105034.1 tripartite tricarboxylate transporter TctB family protein [Paraburkholderia phenoliruptrix]MBW9129680.1 tripartite tricarboxylate transporter TctB family protein [Paraburkholderia ginsengiterrae]